jgi:hypothetical protein
MVYWIFKLRFRRRLKKQKSDPNKVDLNVKFLKASAIIEVLDYSKAFLKQIEDNLVHILKRTKKTSVIEEGAKTLRKETNGNSEQSVVFTEYEIQKIKSLNRFYYTVVTLFILAESYLYFLTAQVFIPGSGTIPKMILALFLAMVVMVILNYSFEQHFKYRELLNKKEEGDISENELKNANDKRKVGYFLMAVSFIIILAAAFVRIYFLEQIDLTGYSQDQVESLKKVAFWSSILTLAVTFGLAVFMAMAKRNQFENKMKLQVYKKWKENISKLSQYKTSRTKIIDIIKSLLEETLEKYWQLVLEIRRIYMLEYDDNKKDIYDEYNKERMNGTLVINDTSYIKYEQIQSIDERLFKYGILNADSVKKIFEKIEDTDRKIQEIQDSNEKEKEPAK